MKGNGPAAKAAVKEREPEPEPPAPAEPVKFRRGDLVVFQGTSTTSYIGRPNETREDITVAEVTSVTRDGQVKAFRDLAGGNPHQLKNAYMERRATAYRLPQGNWDTAAIERAVRARNFAPFENLAATRAAFRPHKRP